MACPQHHQYIWFCLVTFICLHCQDCTAHPQGGNGEGITFYVSAAGDDTWSGRGAIPNADRTDGPLATVNRAAVLSKEHKDVVVTVKIEPWTYYLDSTLSLDSSHSRLGRMTKKLRVGMNGCYFSYGVAVKKNHGNELL